MALGKIDHIECYVGDLEKAKKYFTEKLGFKFLRCLGGDGIELQSPAGDFSFDLHQGSEELYKAERERPGGPCHVLHIAFKVDDINKEYEELKSKGVLFAGTGDAPGFNPVSGRTLAGVRDADGCYWIQLAAQGNQVKAD